jgi:hypothetical protein
LDIALRIDAITATGVRRVPLRGAAMGKLKHTLPVGWIGGTKKTGQEACLTVSALEVLEGGMAV